VACRGGSECVQRSRQRTESEGMSKPQLSVRSNSLFACDPKLRVMCKMVVPSTVVLASVLSIVAVRPGVLSMIGSQWGSSWGARTGGREGGMDAGRLARWCSAQGELVLASAA
jgi:hypothetical protein